MTHHIRKIEILAAQYAWLQEGSAESEEAAATARLLATDPVAHPALPWWADMLSWATNINVPGATHEGRFFTTQVRHVYFTHTYASRVRERRDADSVAVGLYTNRAGEDCPFYAHRFVDEGPMASDARGADDIKAYIGPSIRCILRGVPRHARDHLFSVMHRVPLERKEPLCRRLP